MIANSRVDCFIDNKVVVSCWECQLSQMPTLASVMKDIFFLTSKFNLGLKTFFVPSKENPADFPSRSLSDADCKLSSLAWKLVDQAFGPHSVDLMALSSNVQCDSKGPPLRYFSPSPNPGSKSFRPSAWPLWKRIRFPSLSFGRASEKFFVLTALPQYFCCAWPMPQTFLVANLAPQSVQLSQIMFLGSKGHSSFP